MSYKSFERKLSGIDKLIEGLIKTATIIITMISLYAIIAIGLSF